MSASKRRSSLKLIILGDSRYFFRENTNSHSVGKTCIIQQFVFNKFSDKYKSTIGADFFPRDVMIDNTPYSVQVPGGTVFSALDLGYCRPGTLPESWLLFLSWYGCLYSCV